MVINSLLWTLLIILYEKTKQTKLELATAREAFQRFGSYTFGTMLMHAASRFGEFSEIMDAFRKIKTQKAGLTEEIADMYIISTGWYMMTRGDFKDAVEPFQYLLNEKTLINDNQFHVLINIAHCNLSKGDMKAAIRYYTKAIDLQDNFYEIYEEDRSELFRWIETVKWEEALRLLEK